jgi:hypothetical protein
VSDILGIDGSHITADQLEIKPRYFRAADLTQPLRMRSSFDLAVSLEVAEHLGETEADQFVESLCELAPVVLFSAAIPFQGGEHHLNEQWPAYWAARFKERDFVALDPFRRLLWERTDVDWWYSQNLVLYARKDYVLRSPQMSAISEQGIPTYVHPRNYLNHTWQNRVLHLAVDLATVTRSGDVIVLADEDRFGQIYLPGRTIRPFTERNGAYYGPPRDSAHAIEELDRMEVEGATHFALGWPSFWWLRQYPEFARHLEKAHITVLKNEHAILYRASS